MILNNNAFVLLNLSLLDPNRIASTMAYWSGKCGQLAIGWMAFVIVLLAAFRVTQPVDLRLLDVQFKILRNLRSVEPVQEVALVGIDEVPSVFRLPRKWHQAAIFRSC